MSARVHHIDRAPAAAPERLDNQSPQLFGQTPSQTVGPFFHFGLPWKGGADLTGPSDLGARLDLIPQGHYELREPSAQPWPLAPLGERIEIGGEVLDERGAALPDALLEIWQANAAGRYRSAADPRASLALDPAFFGFGRAATDREGRFLFRTVRPGRVPFGESDRPMQAPHIALGVLGRGLLKRLVTRIYFEDEASNADDPVLALVPEQRRATLIARRVAPTASTSVATYRFDVHLQGERETVFFEF